MTHNMLSQEQLSPAAAAARIAELEQLLRLRDERIANLEGELGFSRQTAAHAAQNGPLYEEHTRNLEDTVKKHERYIRLLQRNMDGLCTLVRELEAQAEYLRQEQRTAAEHEAALRHQNECLNAEIRSIADRHERLSGVELDDLQLIELAQIVVNIQSSLVAAKLALARSQGALAGAVDRVEVEFPDTKCPITTSAMQDPVVAGDGHSYERSAIEHWFAQQIQRGLHPTSPNTNLPLASLDLCPNHTLRKLIQALCVAQCDRAPPSEHP
jgi:hypothetical protein